MNEAQGAAGTGEAEQPTQKQQEPKVEGAQEKPTLSPLQAAVRKELGIQSQEQPKEEPKEKPEEEPGEEPAEEEEQPAEDLPAAAETAEEEEEEALRESKDVAALKKRMFEEADKRRKRTKERDDWKAEAERLAAQLQQKTQAPVFAQGVNPVAHILDANRLEQIEADYTQILDLADDNPDGAYDVFMGKNPDGSEDRQDFPVDKIKEMKRDARLVLRNVPKQRVHIEKVRIAEKEARKVYPELFQDTQAGREAAGVLQQNPWLLQHPDYALHIGDYLDGRNRRLAKQGKSTGKVLGPGAQAILGAPKVAVAPGVIKSRSASGGPGAGPARGGGGERVDEKRANEEFYAKGGTSEALEEKIKRKLEASRGNRAGGKQAALV